MLAVAVLAALFGVAVPAAAQSDPLSFGSATVDSRLYDTGTAITPIVLPEAAGGTGAVSYALTPATLPRGLTWTASTRTIAGTPSHVTAATDYTWTATDAGGVAVALTFSLQVWAPAGPAINGVDVLEWTVNGVTKSNYQSGETIKLLLQYPEKVAVTGTPQLALDVGGRTRTAGYDAAETAELRQAWAADTADVLVFTYTVRADDFDGDGAAVAADALRLNGGTIRTVAAATDVKLSLGSHAVASGGTVSAKMRVRDTAPSFSQAASAADRSLARGVATSTTLPRATGGDGALTYTISPALPRGLALGSATAAITGTPAASGATTHTLTAADADGDRAALGPFTITVAAANAPKPSALTIVPPVGFDGDYAAGEVIWAIVTFDRAVTITGAPQLALTIGAHVRQAAYSSISSDPDDISFKYTVTAADFDGDGISIDSAALTLNGGGITGAGDAAVAAARDLSAYDLTNDGRYTVRDTQPSFGSASIGNKTYPTGTAVNESLPAATGGDGTVRYSLTPALPAGLAFDAGRRRIHGTPTAQAAGADYTYRATDGDGDGAALTFRLAVTSVPTVSGVTVSSSPASGNAYGVAETISVEVRFDQAVTVTTPNPSLELTVGSNARSAAFASKPNASTLRFSYRVQADDDDDDGIGIAAGALSLTGAGTLRDATGTRNANLALGSHAIAAAAGHQVDTPPIISGVAITSSPAGGNYAAGDVISVRLTFTESVYVRSDEPTVALTIGADTRTATWHSGTSAPPSHTFTYTVQASDFDGDGISIAAGAVTANGGFLTYSGSDDPYRQALVGLGSHAVTDDDDHRVRDTAPAFSATVPAQHYVAGTAASLTLPTATGDGSISYELTSGLPGGLAYGSATRAVSGTPQAAGAASEQTWVATDGDGDETALTFTITVASATAPKVSALTFLSTPRTGDTYGPGETIAVGIKFDKNITKTGTPRLALAIGARTRYANYFASPSSLTGYHHVFSYTVQGADRDADGIAIGASALELNGGSITQSSDAGVAASLALGSHAVAAAGSHKVDGGANAAPAVRAVGIQSRPVAASGYAAGDVIRLSVGFTEALTVTGAPRLAIRIGATTRQATFDRAELKRLHFRYTVLVSDDDADGISVAADALTLPSGATVRDAHGADAALGLGTRALANQLEHKVHTPPKVTGLSIVSTPQQAGTYTRGGVVTARVSYDQAVTVAGSPRLALTIGGQSRAATAAAGSGNAYVDFNYTVAAGDTDADGLGITGGALTLPTGATIRDAGATDAALDLSRYAATRYAAAKVDGSRTGLWPDFGSATGPDLSMLTNRVVNYSLHSSCGPLHVGCALPTSATGDAPLVYTVSPALPAGLSLNRATAVLTGAATVAAPSTRHTLTVTDANGDTDAVTFTLAVVGARPTVRGVSFLSSPAADSTYARNEEIRVAVRFRRQGAAALAVTGAPRLALQVGRAARQAAYYGVSGDEVRFRYTVQAADRDADGVAVAAGALTLNGGAIRDAAGNAAVLGLGRHALSSQAAHKVDGGVTRAPSVAGVTITSRPATGDTYSRGETVEVAVRFSQGVGVTGSPRLALSIGSATRQAAYDRAGATSATQYFRYVVQQADVDADGLSIRSGALTLNNGAIRSNAGANAALALGSHAITNASNAKVNGALNSPAIVTGVAVTSRPATGDTFRIGEEIRVRVTFSKAVVASRRTYRQGNPGWPRLALTVGSHTRHAALKVSTQYTERAPASTTLEFGYTVPAGDYDGDGFGIAHGALDVNLGGVSRDGVAATLSLGSHAVSAAAYKVDGRRAAVSRVSITSRPGADNTYAAGEVIRVAVTFNLPVRVTATAPNLPALGLLVGSTTRQMAYAGAGANSIAFSYAVQAADRDADGVSMVSSGPSLNGAVIETAANGNPAVTGLSGFSVQGGAGHKVDGSIRPPVVRSLSIGAPQRGSTFDRYEVIGINVRFSQSVTVTGTPRLSLVIGSSTKTLDLASASGSQLRFEYEVQAGDADGNGVDVPANSLALNGATIRNQYGVNAALGHGSIRNYVTNASTPNVNGAANHPPVVVSAGFAGRPAGGVYGKGDAIDVVVNWGKPVTVTGTPQLALDVGSGTRQAGRHSGSQRYTRFRYLVVADDRDGDGIGFGSGALTLNGATITGPGGTTASLTLPAVAADANRRVDGRVLMQPAFTGTVSARTWVVGSAVSYALPAAAGARGAISYALRPALPDGLQFSAASRTISGTPTTVTAAATYTLEATDGVTGAKGALNFSIEITANAAPVFIPATFAAQVYVKDEAISPVALPAATGGNGALSYALTGPGAATTLTLPAGVAYTAPTGANTGGTISGTPTAVAAQASYTLTATDADDDQATLTFTLEVQDDAAPTFGAASVANQSWRRYKALTAFTLPAATGGNGTLTYTLSPALPAGAAKDASHRISGAPTVAMGATTYTWRATDRDGDRAELTFTITVADNSLPAFTGLAPTSYAWTRYKSVSGILPVALGGDPPLSYALAPALPAGVARAASPRAGAEPDEPVVDSHNRTLAGAPTAAMAQSSYAWTVTDADGDRAAWNFTITVLDNGRPDFGAATIPDQSWTRRRAITAFTLPAATGGDGSVSYALSPALPGGVTKDAGHRVSGAPTAALAQTEYTWTATDGDGDQASLTFDVTVADRPQATLILTPSTIAESGTGNAATVTATLDRAVSAATTVTVAAAAGTNAEAGDFTLSANKTLTIAAGDTTSTGAVTITAVNNADAELDKSVTVSGSVSNAEVDAPDDVTLTITDDDRPSTPTLFIDAPSVTEGGTGDANTLEWTVTLLPASTQRVQVGVAVNSTGTATVGTLRTRAQTGADHGFPPEPTLVFAAGVTTQTVPVTVYGDATPEPDETVVMELSNPSNASLGNATGTGTILDDDAPAVTLAVADAAIAENGGTTTVTATLKRAWSAATTVTVTAVAGAYTVGADATITIAAGQTANAADSVTITAVDDAVDNVGDRAVTVTGTATESAHVTGAALTLTDDEATPEATLALSDAAIDEHDGTNPGASTVTATLNRASSEAVTLTVAATAGTNAADGDFSLSNTNTLTITAGTTSSTGTVTVTAVDNTVDAPDKEVTVSATVSGNSGVATPADVTLTIEDDEAAPTVALAVADASISENGGSTTVTATLSHASSAATTITVTAVSGAYTVGADATITIAAGETSNTTGSVTITAVDDAIDNVDDRAVTVTGTAANAQAAAESQTVSVTGAALTLTDDETTPTATLALSPATVDEHDGTNPGSSTVTATLNRASSEAVTLTVGAAAGTNAASGDFSLSSAKTLTIAAGETTSTGTVTVTAVDNTVSAPDKQVTVSATVSGDSGVADPASVTLTIEDDEAAPTVALAVADASISENGGTTTVTATLSHASSAPTTITVTAVDGAYTVGSDATITIAAGETTNATGSVTITAVNDAVDNVGNRAVTVTGTAANAQAASESQTVSVTGAALTLTDDETTPTATLALSDATIDEYDGTNPGSATVTATLNRASTEAVTLTVAAAAGTNAASGDFSLSSAETLTIAAGDTSSTGTVTVTSVDNTVDAPDKQVTVSATVSGNSGVADPASVTLTIEDDEAAPTVALALADSSISENGGTTTVTATLSHASSAATTITVQPEAGAYTVGADATITIAAGETSNAPDTATITAVDDAIDNVANRTATVTGTAANAQAAAESATVSVTGAALTLTDDEGAPTATLALSDATIDEHDGTNPGSATVTATLNRASTEAVTLTVATTAGTNAVASDFSLSSAKTLTIAAGDTSSTGTVTVTAVDNTADAPDKQVTVSATVSGNSGVADPASVTLTIEDDEAAPTVALALADSSISENGGSTTVTATLSHPSSAATTITVQPEAGAYTVGADATITIAAGETSNAADTATITAVDDATDNVVNRSATVTGTAQNSHDVGAVTGAALTLTDDETTPTATLALSDATIDEHDGTNPGSATVTATLNRASSEAVTLTVAVAAGTNAAATDYNLSSAKTLTIAAGDTSSTGTVTVTAVNNTVDAPDKQVTVSATASGNSGVADPSSVTLTIEDDEAAPTVTLAVADASISENGGATTVTATLSHASSAATTVTVTAVAGAYTVGADATITIAAGETTNATDSVTITAVNDAVDNVGDRAVTVTGTAANAQAAAESQTVTVTGVALTLTDDETTPTATLALSDATIDEHDGTNPGASTVTATLNRASTEAVTLTVVATAGTNAASGDFSLSSAKTLTIAAGDTTSTGTVTVTAVDNTVDAPDKQVTVSATVSGNSGVADPASVTLTIEDDEAAPTVALAVADAAISENGGTSTVTATLSHASSAATTVTVQPEAGAYTVGADATITIAAGETSNATDSVTITAVDDSIDNVANRSTTVSGTAQNSHDVGTVTGASLTLTDDEGAPTATLALSDATIDEHDGTNPGSATVTATLNRASTEAVTLTVAASAGTNAASGDFSLSSAKTLTIAAGDTSSTGTVTVTAVDNTVDAPDKEVTVSATVSGNSGVAAPADVTLTIEDDEAAPTVALAVADASISENGGTTTVTATLSHASSAATTITVTAVSGAYTVGSDTTITIAAGETSNAADSVTITAVDDSIDNVVNRSTTVTGTAVNAQAAAESATVTVTGAALTLTDDEDTPEATLALSPATVDEHDGTNPGSSTVTATLNRASSESVTLTVAAAAGTNAAAGDFSLSSAKTLTIAAGETSSTGTVTVTAVDNTVDAPDKEVTVSATVSGASGVADPASVTLTIEDDEAAPTVALALADSSISENGGSTTVTATLSHPSSAATTITVQPEAGAYTVGSDTTITIVAGETANAADTATITAADDSIDNVVNRSATVTATAQNSYNVGAVTGAALTLTDDETTPTATLALSDATIDEHDGTNPGSATVTATLNRASSEAVTLTVGATAGTNAASGDFSLSSAKTLTIAAGEISSTGTVTVTAVDNTADAPDKQVTVSATVSGNSGVADPASVTLTVEDDEAAPTVALALADSSISENGGSTTVTATLSHPSSATTTITVQPEAGAYTVGADATITIAAGETSSAADTATITAVDDAIDNVVNRSTTVTGTAVNAQAAAESATVVVTGAALTLTDDEATPEATLALSPATVDEHDGTNPGSATVTATLNRTSSEAVTLTVAAAAGTNAASGDFSLSSTTTLTIAAGDTSSTGTVTVTAVDNTADAPDKEVTVSATVSGNSGVADPASVTLTIEDDEAAPTVALAVADALISENGGATTVTATLSHASSAATTVTVQPASGAYTVGADTTITIAAGETANTADTVTITAVNDAIDNVGNRSTTVTGTAANAQAAADSATVSVTGAALTLTDDEATPEATLALSRATVDEHDGTNPGSATVTATLDRASSEAVTLTVAAAAGTNAASGDFSLSSAKTLTIAAGDTSSTGTVTVTAVDNTADAPDKQVTVSATVSGNSGVADPSSVTLTIEDDEATPTVALALADSSISENGGSTTVTATLSHPSSASTTITVQPEAGAYTVGADATITIAAGETSNAADTATITAVDDAIDNVVNRSATVTATAQNSHDVGAVTGAALTLTDDETTPTATLALSAATIDEHDGTSPGSATVTATLNRASSEAVTLTVAAAAGTNAASGDFSLSSAKTLTIAAGDTTSTGTVTVTAVDNTADAPDKQVTVSATVSGGSGVATPADVTLTIEDDEAAPKVTLVLSPSSISEDGGQATVTATLSHASSVATTVTVAATAGAHTVAADFSLSANKVLTIAAGTTTSTGAVTISAVDDDADAPNDKTVSVSATAANSHGAGNPNAVTLTITDDDVDLKPTFGGAQVASRLWPTATVIPRLVLPRATGGDGTLTYTLSPALPSWLSRNGFLVTGTTPDDPTNQVEYTWTVEDEDGDEDSVKFLAAVIRPGDPPLLVNPPGIVVNTGDLPAPSLSSPRVTEGASGTTSALTWTVTLSKTSTAQVTVKYADAGTGTATSGTDYAALSGGTLTFAPGETSKTVTVTVTGDGVDEPNETVKVSLSEPVNARLPVSAATGTGTIEDDDAAPTVTLAVADSAISENGGTTTVTATLSHASSAATTITVTAVSGAYTVGADATITIAAGATSNASDTATVTAVNDAIDNVGDRSVTVTGTAANAQAAAESATMTVTGAALTLTDDEATPEATLALSDAAIDEHDGTNAGSATVTATLNRASSEAVTLTVAAAAGTNAAAGDFSLSSANTLTIAAGDTSSTGTVSVTAVDNTVDAPDKEVTVSAVVSGISGVAAPSSVTLTIEDDEAAPTVALAVADSAISENGGATTVTATLSHASSAATTVTVTAVSGAYTVDADATITIAAGATSNAADTVTITAVNDAIDNVVNRSTTVTGTAANAQAAAESQTVSVTGAALTLTDDEGAPTATLALSPAAIDEHDGTNPGASTVTATLSRASTEAVTLTVEATAGTNAASGDFSLSSAKTLTIAAGDTTSTGTVTVTAVDNTVDAPDKQVTVSATVSGNSGVAAPASVTLTIEDDEAAPTVALAVADASISENGGATTVTATLSHASSAATTVTVQPEAGAYTVDADATITIAAGETTNATDSVTITAVDDAIDNVGDRAVTVTGTAANAQAAAESATVSVTGAALTLTDDEGAPEVTLALSPAAIDEHDGTNPGAATVTAALNRASTEAVTLTVEATAGTNAAATDFSLSSTKTLTIAAGETTSTGTVTVTAVDNTVDAPDKQVTVSATVSGDSGVAAPADVTLTIKDDEAAPTVTLALSQSAIDESGGATTVTATLSHPSGAATTITVPAMERAYTVGTDATITIAAGETANAADGVTITAMDNDVRSGDRTVMVMGTVENSMGAGTMTGAELTIRDDDGGTGFALNGWVEDQQWTQGQAITPFTLPAAVGGNGGVSYALAPALPSGVSRDADTREVTGAPAAARAETEYTWTATDSVGATVSVTFTIEVAASSGQTDTPPRRPPPPGGSAPPAAAAVPVTVSIGDASIMEGDGATVEAEFTVTLNRESPVPVTVSFITKDDTAIAGADYEHCDGVVTFAPGQTSQMITVPVLPDTTVEANEEFMVALAGEEHVLLEREVARGRIGDNDVALLAIDDTRVKEGDRGAAAAWFEVRMISKTERPVPLRYATMDGTARAGQDYRAAGGVLVFAPGEAAKRFAVTVLGDTEPEEHETFGVTLYDAEQRDASAGLAAEGTIEDDDRARLQRALRRAHAEFARVVATDAVAVIGGRLRDGPAGSQVTLHGRTLSLDALAAGPEAVPAAAPEPEADPLRRVSLVEFLGQSSIDLRTAAPHGGAPDHGVPNHGLSDNHEVGGPAWSIWGTGTLGGHSGAAAGGAAWDGTVTGGYLGADLRVAEPLLVGLALSHKVGATAYRESGDGDFKAQVETGMTSVLPYVLVEPLADLDVWAIGGVGFGGSGVIWRQRRLETANLLWLGAAGARYAAVSSATGLNLSVGTDGYYAWLGADSEQAPWLTKDAGAAVGRVRLLADARYDWQVSAESLLGLNVEVGGRWDAGDAASGFGAEVGGGVGYAHAGIGLEVRANGRYLVAHEDREFRDWGASAAVRFDPGAPGRGVAVAVAPEWGAAGSQAASVWAGVPLVGGTGAGPGSPKPIGLRPDHLAAEVSYGIVAGGEGLVTFYGGLSQALTDRPVYRVGSRMNLGGLDLDLSVDRQERAEGSAGYRLELAGAVHW